MVHGRSYLQRTDGLEQRKVFIFDELASLKLYT